MELPVKAKIDPSPWPSPTNVCYLGLTPKHIEGYIYTQRMHSSLNYLTPPAVEIAAN